MISKPVRVSQKNPDRIPIIKTLHKPDGGGGDGRRQREDELAEARQAMGGDDPAPPTPTFEPVRRPSPAYGLPRGNLVAGGCRQGGKGAGAGEETEMSEQTRTARCAQRGRPGLPPGTPCSSRPRPCTWSTAAVRTLPKGMRSSSLYLENNNKQHDHHQRRRERRGLAARRVAARERGAARKGEEIKKFVRASAELVTWTEGISN